jgi:hypothetical protein
MATAMLLEGLAEEDASVGELPSRAMGSVVRALGPSGPATLHAYVKRHVQFRPEKGEVFQSPATSLELGYGDCDDSVRLFVASARAAGYPARFVYFLQHGQPAHVAAQVKVEGRWHWAECTVDAYFGEHPFDAARRLGMKRPDMSGEAVTLTGAPLGRTMGSMGSLVSKVKTPVTAQALAGALYNAWSGVFGTDPNPTAILILVAQSALETGLWAYCYNFNLGNVHAWSGWSGDTFSGTDQNASGGSYTTPFVSFSSLQAGAAFWLGRFKAQWGAAMSEAESGDIQGFAQALYDAHYYTGISGTAAQRVAAYASGIQKNYDAFVAQGIEPGGLNPASTPGPGSAVGPLLVAIAFGVGAAFARSGLV